METPKENLSRAFDKSGFRQLLKLKYLPTWFNLLLLVILAYVPNRLRDAFAWVISWPVSFLPLPLRRVTYANMRVAFSDMSARECRRLYQKCLTVNLAVMMAYAEPMVLPLWLLKRRWVIVGGEHLDLAVKNGRPIIFVAPHTCAIDRCGLYLSYHGLDMCTMVKQQRNPVYDWFLNVQRLRFGGAVYERSAGLRTIIRELRNGRSCFFLPDQDLGPHNARFIPFLGVPKATLSTLPKLAKVGNAQVMQLFSVYNLKTACFEVHFSPLFENFPSADLDYDLRVMNEHIEAELLQHREQYMWFLRFFKTFPDPSYPDIYKNALVSMFKKGEPINYPARRKPYEPKVNPTEHSG